MASTTAAFSLAGTYVLRLSADDGELNAFEEISATISDPPPPDNNPPSIPTGLAVSGKSSGSVDLTWQPSTEPLIKILKHTPGFRNIKWTFSLYLPMHAMTRSPH